MVELFNQSCFWYVLSSLFSTLTKTVDETYEYIRNTVSCHKYLLPILYHSTKQDKHLLRLIQYHEPHIIYNKTNFPFVFPSVCARMRIYTDQA